MTPSALRPWSYFPLGFRAYRDTFRFTGRARRLEVAEFYLISMLLGLFAGLPRMWGWQIEMGSYLESYRTTMIATDAIRLLIMLPFFALMARRVRDLGLPGWPVPPLLAYVAIVNEWKTLAFVFDIEAPSGLLQLSGLPIVVAMMIAWFIPGTPGPNRYGPDPRL